jgi:hypothetical protein
MRKSNLVFFILFLIFLFSIFKNWLISPYIIGGDWPFFFQEYVNHFSFLPPIWNSAEANGLGGQSVIYATDSYLYFTGWLFSVILHVPWPVVYKVVWYGLFLALSTYSSIYLYGTVLPKSPFWQKLLAALIYTSNTYILLVAGGGQAGVLVGYAWAPLVLARFIILQKNIFYQSKLLLIRDSLQAGLFLGMQILFDLRFAYITMCGVLLYVIANTRFSLRQIVPILLYILLIPIGLSVLLHAYWLLPLVAFRQNPVATLGSAYTAIASVQFFSFATFSNTIGLLHPYWPENIFGQVGFMKPEFLVIPLIAYLSLVFVGNKKFVTASKKVSNITHQVVNDDKMILYFALLGLLGAFLAKGSTDPFGGIYLWSFTHIPGFVLFRDPTKWYTLIAISYSILIPFTLCKISDRIKVSKRISAFNSKNTIFNIQNLFVIVFLIFWLFTIRQAVLGKLGVTFAHHDVPVEYVQLKNVLIKDSQFSRTLWIPNLQRFGYYDQSHPALVGTALFNATRSEDMVKILEQKNAEQKLEDLSIKYVIVPLDSEHEIFLKDRSYNLDYCTTPKDSLVASRFNV